MAVGLYFLQRTDCRRVPGPSKGVFQAVPGAGFVGLVDRETLKRQLDGDAHVFDTRTRSEFTGEDMRNRTRGGHLPSARHLSHTDLLEKVTSVKLVEIRD